MADPLDVHSAQVAEVDRLTALRMLNEYRAALRAVRADIDALGVRITEARAAGEAVNPGWLFRQERYRSLMRQIETQLAHWTGIAAGDAAMAQRMVLSLADGHLQDEMVAALGEPPATVPSFNHLPVRSIEEMVGFASDGSPLARLFASLNALGVQAARHALVAGLALGRPVDVIAREVRGSMGVPLWRGLLIARTETHRAYREAKRVGIEENASALEGWVWHTAMTTRTCAACWAMEGTFYPIETVDRIEGGSRVKVSEVAGMATHPNCRCTLSPRAKPYSAIVGDPSLPDNRPPLTSGAEAFARLTPAQRLRVLGPSKAALYETGQISLSDLAERTQNPAWGPGIAATPLHRLQQRARKSA